MPWPDFRLAVDEARGTLIVEQYSLKGPFRWWWTPDDLYDMCPIPVVDCLEGMPNDERYRPLAEWCRQMYMSTEGGRGLLIDGVPNDDIAFPESALGSQCERLKWLKVAPPESLRRYKKVDGE